MYRIAFIASALSFACSASIQQKENIDSDAVGYHVVDLVQEYYQEHASDSSFSISKGSVSNGSLVNGKLIPFSGKNYFYFDTLSYISDRAFLNDKVLQTVLGTYKTMENLISTRQFGVMECSHKEGGKLFPHLTHQNGLSVDFMMPLNKENKPYEALDKIGKSHYLLSFDNDGKLDEDPTVEIDFDVLALHLIQLSIEAKKYGLKVKKVILKTELKVNLYASKYGSELRKSDVYIVQNLKPIINDLHDDHYHVDFEVL